MDVEGARTAVPALDGERAADLVLVNDSDLTFAKIRFDSASLQTLTAGLSHIADPLARAVCWAALWDMTRDAELPSRQFVDLVARHAAGEGEELLVERILTQAHVAMDVYGDPANRDAVRARLHAVAVEQVRRTDLSADLRLCWVRTLVGKSTSAAELDRLEALLDDRESFEGIPIDTDLRWLIAGQLADEGRADARFIAAEVERDPTDIGRRRAAAAMAARPSAEAKAEAWPLIIDPKSPIPNTWQPMLSRNQSLSDLAALMGGYGIGPVALCGFMRRSRDPELLRPYVAKYFDSVRTIWETRTIDEAEVMTEILYPRYLIDDSVVAAADRLLEEDDLPTTARRILKEGRDGTLRAQRARAADIAAG